MKNHSYKTKISNSKRKAEMFSTARFTKIFFFLFFLIPFVSVFAQEDFEAFYKPGISLKINTDTRWSYSFSIKNREGIYSNEDYEFVAQFIELNHSTAYKPGKNGKFALAIKYRFSEPFNDASHNEFRITEQYGFSNKHGKLEFGHRFRFEQRFRKNTAYRTRYRFTVEIPLNDKEHMGEWELELQTEALLSLEEGAAPEIDQRFEVGIEHQLFKNTEISLSAEYQYDDYFHDPQPDLFIYTGIDIEI